MSRAPSTLPLVFVRPYSSRIRSAVTKLVLAAGCTVVGVVEEGTPDAEAVPRVLALGARALVVPFHAHRSRTGEALDGFSFLRALHTAEPAFRRRILMPVSTFATAAVGLQREELAPQLRDAVMFLHEQDLADPANVARIAAHFALAR
jgi:hypothetical protein